MAITVLEVEVANPSRPSRTKKLEFLVDSGAVFSVVSKKILKELGIKPLSKQTFRLADGRKVVRKKGSAVFKFENRVGTRMLSSEKMVIALYSEC